jgi:hypothetical protein
MKARGVYQRDLPDVTQLQRHLAQGGILPAMKSNAANVHGGAGKKTRSGGLHRKLP